jgi:hypothetical protein
LFGLVVTQKPDKSEPNGSTFFEMLRGIGSAGQTVDLGSDPPSAESGDRPPPDKDDEDEGDEAIAAFRTYFFHLVLWTYAFGILCIVLSRVLP